MLQELRKSKLHRFILSNRPKSFSKTNTVFTGLPDFYKLILPVFQRTLPKSKPKEITYRNFKNLVKKISIKNLGQIFEKMC